MASGDAAPRKRSGRTPGGTGARGKGFQALGQGGGGWGGGVGGGGGCHPLDVSDARAAAAAEMAAFARAHQLSDGRALLQRRPLLSRETSGCRTPVNHDAARMRPIPISTSAPLPDLDRLRVGRPSPPAIVTRRLPQSSWSRKSSHLSRRSSPHQAGWTNTSEYHRWHAGPAIVEHVALAGASRMTTVYLKGPSSFFFGVCHRPPCQHGPLPCIPHARRRFCARTCVLFFVV